MNTEAVLFFLTIAMFGVVCLAVGYAYHVSRLLNRYTEITRYTAPVRRVGGQSDVDKSEGWMPLGKL